MTFYSNVNMMDIEASNTRIIAMTQQNENTIIKFSNNELYLLRCALAEALDASVSEQQESKYSALLDKIKRCCKIKFCKEYGSIDEGLEWAVERGLTYLQAEKLYLKVVDQSKKSKINTSVEDRRQAFIDEVDFYLSFK